MMNKRTWIFACLVLIMLSFAGVFGDTLPDVSSSNIGGNNYEIGEKQLTIFFSGLSYFGSSNTADYYYNAERSKVVMVWKGSGDIFVTSNIVASTLSPSEKITNSDFVKVDVDVTGAFFDTELTKDSSYYAQVQKILTDNREKRLPIDNTLDTANQGATIIFQNQGGWYYKKESDGWYSYDAQGVKHNKIANNVIADYLVTLTINTDYKVEQSLAEQQLLAMGEKLTSFLASSGVSQAINVKGEQKITINGEDTGCVVKNGQLIITDFDKFKLLSESDKAKLFEAGVTLSEPLTTEQLILANFNSFKSNYEQAKLKTQELISQLGPVTGDKTIGAEQRTETSEQTEKQLPTKLTQQQLAAQKAKEDYFHSINPNIDYVGGELIFVTSRGANGIATSGITIGKYNDKGILEFSDQARLNADDTFKKLSSPELQKQFVAEVQKAQIDSVDKAFEIAQGPNGDSQFVDAISPATVTYYLNIAYSPFTKNIAQSKQMLQAISNPNYVAELTQQAQKGELQIKQSDVFALNILTTLTNKVSQDEKQKLYVSHQINEFRLQGDARDISDAIDATNSKITFTTTDKDGKTTGTYAQDLKNVVMAGQGEYLVSAIMSSYQNDATAKLDAIAKATEEALKNDKLTDPEKAKLNSYLDQTNREKKYSQTLEWKLEPYVQFLPAAKMVSSMLGLEFNQFDKFFDENPAGQLISGQWDKLMCSKYIKKASSSGSVMSSKYGAVTGHIEGTKKRVYDVMPCVSDSNCSKGTCLSAQIENPYGKRICVLNDEPEYFYSWIYEITYYARPTEESGSFSVTTSYGGKSYTLAQGSYSQILTGRVPIFGSAVELSTVCMTASDVSICNSLTDVSEAAPTEHAVQMTAGFMNQGTTVGNDIITLQKLKP